jgi:putative phage-type endonuclease
MSAHEVAQGTDDWQALRLGKVTASRIADLMARTRTGWGTSRTNYMAELVAERLTGVKSEGFSNAAIKWGLEMEPQARDAYVFFADADVTQIGFVDHPRIAMTGASPDGLVGDAGLVEIKCPLTATHIETLLTASVREKYLFQMQWQMACTGRQWCDFVSYDPRMPERMRYFCQRVPRNDRLIADLEREVSEFLREVADKVAALQAKYPERIAA